MKKKNKTLVSCIVVFLLLLILYVVTHNMNKDSENTDGEENVTESAYQMDKDAQQVTFDSKDGEISFIKENDEWNYAGDEEFPLSQDKFNEIIAALEDISSDRIIDNAENISEFELDDSVLTVKIQNSDESEDILQFGADNDITDSCYMMVNKNESKIYMVSTDVKTSLQFSVNDLAEMEDFPSITGTTINNVKIENEGKTLSLSKNDSSSTGWIFTDENGTEKDAGSTQVTDYMNKIAAFAWDSFAANGSKSEEYGLSSAKKITIDYQITEESEDDSEESKTVDKEEILLIGKQDADGNYYAKLESQNNIYTISSSTIDEILQVTSNDFKDSYVNNYIFADLDKVTITFKNESYEFTKKVEEVEEKGDSSEEGSEEDSSEEKTKQVTTYYMNGQEISMDDFAEFYSKITGLEAQEWTDGNEEVSTEPDLVINFHKDNGIDVTTQYYAYDSSFYLVKDSKNNSALVNKIKVKEIIDAFQEFISDK